MNGAGVRLTFNFRIDFSVGRSAGNFILGFSLHLVAFSCVKTRLLWSDPVCWDCGVVFDSLLQLIVRHGSMFNLVNPLTSAGPLSYIT